MNLILNKIDLNKLRFKSKENELNFFKELTGYGIATIESEKFIITIKEKDNESYYEADLSGSFLCKHCGRYIYAHKEKDNWKCYLESEISKLKIENKH